MKMRVKFGREQHVQKKTRSSTWGFFGEKCCGHCLNFWVKPQLDVC